MCVVGNQRPWSKRAPVWRFRPQGVGLENLDHVLRLRSIPGSNVSIRDNQGCTTLPILPQLVDRWQALKTPRTSARARVRRRLRTSFQALMDAGANLSATDHSGHMPVLRVCWYAGCRGCNFEVHAVYTDGGGGERWAHRLRQLLLLHGADPTARRPTS